MGAGLRGGAGARDRIGWTWVAISMGAGEKGRRSKESLFLTGKAPGVSRFPIGSPIGWIPYPLHTAHPFPTPAYSLDIFFYIFCEIKSLEKVRSPGALKGRLKPQPTPSLLFPSQAGKRSHRAELTLSNLQTHIRAWPAGRTSILVALYALCGALQGKLSAELTVLLKSHKPELWNWFIRCTDTALHLTYHPEEHYTKTIQNNLSKGYSHEQIWPSESPRRRKGTSRLNR